MPQDVCIILPTLNEELSIGSVIDEIPVKALHEMGYQLDIVVADGGSTDRTVQKAQEKGVRVLHVPKGKGLGVRTAIKEINADFIFMLDGDFTYPAAYIPEMLEVLQKYPVVTGSRLKGKLEKGALRRTNFIGNHLLTWLANLLYGTNISDLCTGYWGFRQDVIKSLHLTTTGFQFEAELLTQLAKHKYKIREIPITYRPRQGTAKLGRFKDGMKIGWFLIKHRFSS
ncbi:MAG: glycosyltransferase [Dehalococcoidales bacterium]|nr:glycosyltransferase [Dehalococcoidales bacterium]